MFQCSVVYNANFTATEDIIVNQGGTYSGKTYSIMQALCSIAISQENKTITVVGQDVPNLKRGAMKDMFSIIASSPILKSLIKSYNATDRVYTFISGTVIEFVSYQNAQDAHSGKRDYLFVNECNGIAWAIIEQLLNRTNVRAFFDYNPSAEFWCHEKLLKNKMFGTKTVRLIISDHRHNPFISQAMHDHIEARAIEDPEWGKVYGRGLTGKIEGLIYKNWTTVDSVPDKAELLGYGMDFGFTNSMTSVVAFYRMDGELFLKQMLYDNNLTNPQISDRMAEAGVLKNIVIVADSAEPKSIKELQELGWYVEDAEKGPDSVKNGIDILKRFKLNITKDSADLVKEISRYKWRVNKDGATMNEPLKILDHSMDAMRYFALNRLSVEPAWGYSIR